MGFLWHSLFYLSPLFIMVAILKKELSTDILSKNSCQMDEVRNITGEHAGEQSSTILDLCIKGIDVDGTNIKDCRQLNAIEGWTQLNLCAQWLHNLALFFYYRDAVRHAQMISFLSSSCLLGAILWFALDSPLCTGPGTGLGLSMQIDVVVMLFNFAVLFRSILFGTPKDQNKVNFWKEIQKHSDETIRLQKEFIRLLNIVAARKGYTDIYMRDEYSK